MTWQQKPCWRPSAEDWGSPLHLPAKQAVLPFGNMIQDSLTGFRLICNNGLAFYPILYFHLCHLPQEDATLWLALSQTGFYISPPFAFIGVPQALCSSLLSLLSIGNPIQLRAKSALSLFSYTLGTFTAFWDWYFMKCAGFLFWKVTWMSSNNNNTTRCLCNIL